MFIKLTIFGQLQLPDLIYAIHSLFFPSKPAHTDSKIIFCKRLTWPISDSGIMLKSKAHALSALDIHGNTHFLEPFSTVPTQRCQVVFYCTCPLSSFMYSSSADASPSWYLWGLLLLSTRKYLRKQVHHQQKLVSASLYSFPRMGSNYLLKITHPVLAQESDDQCPTNPRENKHFQLTSFSFIWSFDIFQCDWVLITKEIQKSKEKFGNQFGYPSTGTSSRTGTSSLKTYLLNYKVLMIR